MSKKLEQLLKQMLRSSQTEQIIVADCLLDLAQNGDDNGDDDDFLLAVAAEIRDCAQSIIDRMTK